MLNPFIDIKPNHLNLQSRFLLGGSFFWWKRLKKKDKIPNAKIKGLVRVKVYWFKLTCEYIHPSYRLHPRKLMAGTWKYLKLMQLPSSESPFAGNPMVFGGLPLKNQSPSENGSETLNTSVDGLEIPFRTTWDVSNFIDNGISTTNFPLNWWGWSPGCLVAIQQRRDLPIFQVKPATLGFSGGKKTVSRPWSCMVYWARRGLGWSRLGAILVVFGVTFLGWIFSYTIYDTTIYDIKCVYIYI